MSTLHETGQISTLHYVRNGDTILQNALRRQLNSGAEYQEFQVSIGRSERSTLTELH